MRVIELDRHFFGKLVPVLVGAPESAYEISKGTSYKKKLLHEPEALSKTRRVVRIEDASERLGGQGFRNRANKLAMTENFEIEVIMRSRLPKPERVDGLTAEPHDGPVEWDAAQF